MEPDIKLNIANLGRLENQYGYVLCMQPMEKLKIVSISSLFLSLHLRPEW